MKRIIALLLSIICIFCFAGCNKDDDEAKPSSGSKSVMPVTESSKDGSQEESTTKASGASTTTTTKKDTQQQATQAKQQQTTVAQTTQPQQQTPAQQPQQQQQTTTTTTAKTINITDSDAISALTQMGGGIAGSTMETIYNNLSPERQQKVKDALATATDAAGNVDYSQFASLISSVIPILSGFGK